MQAYQYKRRKSLKLAYFLYQNLGTLTTIYHSIKTLHGGIKYLGTLFKINIISVFYFLFLVTKVTIFKIKQIL